MSKSIKRIWGRPMAHWVVVGDQIYLVDSDYVIDNGFETMVFKSKSYKEDLSDVDFLNDCLSKIHTTFDEMREYHYSVIENLERHIG